MTDSRSTAATRPSARSVTGPVRTRAARWPSLLGLAALAANTVDGAEPHVGAMIIVIAALCYLATAAIGSPRGGWPVLGATLIAVVLSGVLPVDTTGMLLVAGGGFALVGLLRGSRVDRVALAAQIGGFALFGALAVTAMTVPPQWSVYPAAVAALGHGVWDVVHHRRSAVVPRSLAEFCAVLDLGLGLALLAFGWFA